MTSRNEGGADQFIAASGRGRPGLYRGRGQIPAVRRRASHNFTRLHKVHLDCEDALFWVTQAHRCAALDQYTVIQPPRGTSAVGLIPITHTEQTKLRLPAQDPRRRPCLR